jgi:hypothetical protein
LRNEVPGVVQFLPFRLRKKDTFEEVTGYSVGQILSFVDCLDRKRTVVRNNWEPVNEFGDFAIRWPAVLNVALIGDERLFRIRGYSVCIVVRRDLKDTIEKSGFAGQRFDPLTLT